MRKYDQNTVAEIENLIRSADSTSDKGILIILLRVAQIMDDTRSASNASEQRLEHLEKSFLDKMKELDEAKTFSRGFLRAVLTIWLAVQGIVGYVGVRTYEDYYADKAEQRQIAQRLEELERKESTK